MHERQKKGTFKVYNSPAQRYKVLGAVCIDFIKLHLHTLEVLVNKFVLSIVVSKVNFAKKKHWVSKKNIYFKILIYVKTLGPKNCN